MCFLPRTHSPWFVMLKLYMKQITAFLFHQIGFSPSFCLTASAAGRCGAISGFGLFLIKRILLIVRVATHFPGYFDGQYWLRWVFPVLGVLLFLRGFIDYDARNFLLLDLLTFVWVVRSVLCLRPLPSAARTHKGVLSNQGKGRYPPIFDHVHRPRAHYAEITQTEESDPGCGI